MDDSAALERNRPISVELQLIQPLRAVGKRIRSLQQHWRDEARGRARPNRNSRGSGFAFAIHSPMKNQSTDDTAQPALQRDPDEWKTGDEPMTDAQRSYLETLCRETGEEFDDALTKAEASKRIDELRERSPRLSEE